MKKVKEKPVAKSLIIFEVKPYEAETDLDELAKKIIAITMDGLFWKTEYKKAPIAYGVEKIIIGCVVEDEKVSTDDLQEQIEAMDDLVQSVDIAAFNKIWANMYDSFYSRRKISSLIGWCNHYHWLIGRRAHCYSNGTYKDPMCTNETGCTEKV